MRKIVEIKDIYTSQFGQTEPVEGIRLVGYAKEFLDGIELEISGYYLWLLEMIETHKVVWGNIETKEDALKRTERFEEIIQSIGRWGYEESYCPKLKVVDGRIYGAITATEVEGKYLLIDGSHRLSALIVHGYKEVPILICE